MQTKARVLPPLDLIETSMVKDVNGVVGPQSATATLSSLLRRAAPGLRFNEHLDEEDGPLVFAHACKIGLEGIVSKRKDSPYRSGRSPDWIKSKTPRSPAVTGRLRKAGVGDSRCRNGNLQTKRRLCRLR